VGHGSVAYDTSEGAGKVIPLARPMLVQISHPRSFNDAQGIGDRLKGGAVVVVVLHEADRHLASRIRDFAFGLVAGCKGGAAQGGDGILVLTPPGVSMTGTEEMDTAQPV
jgi:cell division inhibitor SepF